MRTILQQVRRCPGSRAVLRIALRAALGIALRAALGIALAASVAACGSGDPLSGLTADQIASRAVSDIGRAPAVTMAGSSTDAGQTTTFDVTLTRGKGCRGTVTENGAGSVQLIKVGGTLWIKPDSQFWTAEGLDDASVLQAVSGKYIQTSSSSSMSELGNLCDVSQLVSAMGTSYSGMSRGATTTLAGQPVVELKSKGNGVFYISDVPAPLLLRVDGGSQGSINFSYGASPKLTPPPAGQTVNGAKYGL